MIIYTIFSVDHQTQPDWGPGKKYVVFVITQDVQLMLTGTTQTVLKRFKYYILLHVPANVKR